MADLVVALDFPTAEECTFFAGQIKEYPVWYKVGLELFTAEGPSLVHRLSSGGKRIFLDMKFHDIPNTVQGATRSACAIGADMLTIHLAGGAAMAKAAVAGRDEACSGRNGGKKAILLGVTVLTSEATDDQASLEKRVVELAMMAKDCGLDGVVCSGLEAAAVKASCGQEFICLCPGIRLSGSADDQARVCTPGQAIKAGADFLVVGRPITRAAVPAQIVEQIFLNL